MEITVHTSKTDSPGATVVALDGRVRCPTRITPTTHFPPYFCLLFILFSIPVALHANPPAPRASIDRANAAKLEAKFDYAGAIVQYRKAYALDSVSALDESGLDLFDIANCYIATNHDQLALDVLQKTLQIYDKTNNPDAAVATMGEIGLAYDGCSEYAYALNAYQDALSLVKQLGDGKDESTLLNNIGMVYVETGQYDKALNNIQQALSIDKKTGSKTGQIVDLNNMGLAYSGSSQYEKSLDYDQQALTLEQQSGDTVSEVSTLANIGEANNDLGLYTKALSYYQQALPAFQKMGNKASEAAILNNLGQTSMKLNQYATALDYLQKALPIKQEIGDRKGAATVLINIGSVYCDLKQYTEAVPYFQQALQIDRQIGDVADQGTTLHNIGVAYERSKQYAKALGFYRQSLVIAHQIGDKDGEANTLNSLMLTYDSLGKSGVGIFYGKQAVNITQSIRAGITGLDAASRNSYLSSHAHIYRDLADLLIDEGRLPEAQQVLKLLKEREFYDFLNPDPNATPPPMDDVVLTLREAHWASIYSNALNTQQISQAAANLDSVQNQISRAFTGKLTSDDTAPNTNDAFDVENTLPQGTIALYTIVSPEKLDLILITPKMSEAFTVPVTADALYKDVYVLRQALTNPNIDPRPAAAVLYNLVLKPLQNDIDASAAKTILFSLDDALRYVPPAVLYNPETKQYVAERYQTEIITLTGSAPALPPPASLAVLGMGVSTSQDGDPALPGVATELSAIVHEPGDTGGILPGRRLMDAQFTQDALETELKTAKYPIVHLASHFALSGTLDTSYLLLGDGAHLSITELARDPRRFQGVDLLTLSACQTAMEARGSSGHEVEGIAALAQKLGAGSVLASLWPVSDAATPELMTDLYKYHQQHPDAPLAEALQSAQLSLLTEPTQQTAGTVSRGADAVNQSAEQSDLPPFPYDPKTPFAHPFYWAPFILIGNWR